MLIFFNLLFFYCVCCLCPTAWRYRPFGTPQVDHACRSHSLEAVADIIRNKHMLLIGDSVSRYTYLALVYALKNGEFLPHLRDGTKPCPIDELSFASWKSFYLQTTASMQPETCDCFRAEEWAPQQVVENRYAYIAHLNCSVTYLQLFGTLPMKSSWPSGYSAQFVTNETSYGQRPFIINGAVDEALMQHFKLLRKADIVIANQGAWLDKPMREQNKSYFERFIGAIESFAALSHAALFWRTTFHETDLAALALLRESKWKILDFTSLVKQYNATDAGAALFWDQKHPNSFVYEELIRTLIGALMNAQCDEDRGCVP